MPRVDRLVGPVKYKAAGRTKVPVGLGITQIFNTEMMSLHLQQLSLCVVNKVAPLKVI